MKIENEAYAGFRLGSSYCLSFSECNRPLILFALGVSDFVSMSFRSIGSYRFLLGISKCIDYDIPVNMILVFNLTVFNLTVFNLNQISSNDTSRESFSYGNLRESGFGFSIS